MQGVPVDALMGEVKRLPQFSKTPFFFLIDEYENLDRDQQRVLNTLIKHCGELYSFKIGVRELGFRERSTLNDAEQLTHPADYRLINISQELSARFPSFAEEVCKQRLYQVLGEGSVVPSINALLPELPAEKEAEKLGVRDAVTAALAELEEGDPGGERFGDWLSQSHPLEIFAVAGRAAAEGIAVSTKLETNP